MIADKMKNMVANSSAIRAMFEEGNRLAGIYGAENVFDFSLGNPSVPAPAAVTAAVSPPDTNRCWMPRWPAARAPTACGNCCGKLRASSAKGWPF